MEALQGHLCGDKSGVASIMKLVQVSTYSVVHSSWLRCSDVSRSALSSSVSVITSHPVMYMGLMEHSVECIVLQ